MPQTENTLPLNAEADARIIQWGQNLDAIIENANRPESTQAEVDYACEEGERLSLLIAETPANSFEALAVKLRIALDYFSEVGLSTSDALNLQSAIADCDRLAKGYNT